MAKIAADTLLSSLVLVLSYLPKVVLLLERKFSATKSDLKEWKIQDCHKYITKQCQAEIALSFEWLDAYKDAVANQYYWQVTFEIMCCFNFFRFCHSNLVKSLVGGEDKTPA